MPMTYLRSLGAIAILAMMTVCLLGASGCNAISSKTAPSGALPVISRFEFAPQTGKAPLSGEFVIEVTGAATCAIEPNIRAVACSGRKSWTVTASGDYVLTATNDKGQSVSAVARVTITP